MEKNKEIKDNEKDNKTPTNKILLISIIILIILLLINVVFLIMQIIKFEKNKKEEEAVETYSSLIENNDTEQTSTEVEEGQKEIDSNTTDWNLILVNKENPIPEDYEVTTEIIDGNHNADYRIVDAINNMLNDARKQGLDPIICSSYRTTLTQQSLFSKKVNYYKKLGYSEQTSEEKASYWVTIPGTSEHEIGLAVDIVSEKYQILDEKQETTEVQQWLIEHCSDYGFILRYPTEKSEITKINYEPWHYRYVGIENAKFMEEKGFCLEEYIEYLNLLDIE